MPPKKKKIKVAHPDLLPVVENPDNFICADCPQKNPRWASVNHGCLICIECSGIHRSMGVHITQVRSLTLDSWKDDWLDCVFKIGNKISNSYFEHSLPAGHRKPTWNNDGPQAMEKWIRQKYERQMYIPPNGGGLDPGSLLRKGLDYKKWLNSGTSAGETTAPSTSSDQKKITISSTRVPTSSGQKRGSSGALPPKKVSSPRVAEVSKMEKRSSLLDMDVPAPAAASHGSDGFGDFANFSADFSSAPAPAAAANGAAAAAAPAASGGMPDLASLYNQPKQNAFGNMGGGMQGGGMNNMGGMNAMGGMQQQGGMQNMGMMGMAQGNSPGNMMGGMGGMPMQQGGNMSPGQMMGGMTQMGGGYPQQQQQQMMMQQQQQRQMQMQQQNQMGGMNNMMGQQGNFGGMGNMSYAGGFMAGNQGQMGGGMQMGGSGSSMQPQAKAAAPNIGSMNFGGNLGLKSASQEKKDSGKKIDIDPFANLF